MWQPPASSTRKSNDAIFVSLCLIFLSYIASPVNNSATMFLGVTPMEAFVHRAGPGWYYFFGIWSVYYMGENRDSFLLPLENIDNILTQKV